MTNYCVDTHAVVWYLTANANLSAKAKQVLDKIFAGQARGYMSIIVLLELFHIGLKHPSFSFPKTVKTLRRPNILIVPLAKDVLAACYRLPKELEIHDRIIAATTMLTKSILITKDPAFSRLSKIKVIW